MKSKRRNGFRTEIRGSDCELGLTEDKIGSDASNLTTSVKKVEKEYILGSRGG